MNIEANLKRIIRVQKPMPFALLMFSQPSPKPWNSSKERAAASLLQASGSERIHRSSTRASTACLYYWYACLLHTPCQKRDTATLGMLASDDAIVAFLNQRQVH